VQIPAGVVAEGRIPQLNPSSSSVSSPEPAGFGGRLANSSGVNFLFASLSMIFVRSPCSSAAVYEGEGQNSKRVDKKVE